MKKILLLTDFSEASRHALYFARSFFSESIADFHLLCAYPNKPDKGYNTSQLTQTIQTAFADQLQAVIADVRQQSVKDWHSFRASVLPGTLLDVVRSALRSESYDVVILGAKKDGTNELVGNSATLLVRHLTANMMIVPADLPIRSVHRIVLATDFSSLTNWELLQPVKDIVALKGAILTLLTIDVPGKKMIHVDQQQRIRQFFGPVKPAIARLQAPSVKEGIDAYLNGHMADLLVTIPKHKDRTDALSGKSTTRKLVYSPDVPVLTLYNPASSPFTTSLLCTKSYY
ncbi:universal stress protein [Spirosoma sp.]|uniref:universal stress protein n=1 Tax=Spirosoma sp. TaxID=1899569 RepID=UPI00262123C4|nr:universal stress protein [Spirosoma sp.]MCX6217203.1 universal stress protein [Spirosoma sp.]